VKEIAENTAGEMNEKPIYFQLINFLVIIYKKHSLVEQEFESSNIKSIFIPKKETVWFIIGLSE
jgi:hypothetical protein